MDDLQQLAAMAARIDSDSRIEGDAECAFYAGHWHGKPVKGGMVAALDVTKALTLIPTEEFTDAEGRILFDINEHGQVAPKGTLAKLAEEAAKAEAAITPEVPAEPAPEVGENFTPEAVPESVPTEPQPVAQDAPSISTEAPAVTEPAPETPAPVEAPPADPVPEPTPEPAPEPAPEAPQEAPVDPAPAVEPAPEVVAEPAPEAAVEAPAEASTETVAEETPASEPTPVRKKRSSL